MLFWRVPNKMEQRKELIGFYVSLETILSNFTRNWQSFTASLVLQIVMWRHRDAREPLTPERKPWVITPAPTKPCHSVLSRRAKCPCFHQYTLESRLWPMHLSKTFPFFSGEEAETGRAEVLMDTWSVNICHFRARLFPFIIVLESMLICNMWALRALMSAW